jgi:hypothetical protein
MSHICSTYSAPWLRHSGRCNHEPRDFPATDQAIRPHSLPAHTGQGSREAGA